MKRWLVVVMCLWSVPKVDAEPIEVRFLGTLTSVNPLVARALGVGDPMVIDLKWETSAVDRCGPSDSGIYSMIGGSMFVGGRLWTTEGGIIESDAGGGNCGFTQLGTGIEFKLSGWQTSEPSCTLLDPDCVGGVPYPLGILINLGNMAPPVVWGWQSIGGAMPGLPREGQRAGYGSRAFSATGTLQAMPEPASWVLVGTGVVWLARRRWR
jgi:hypothetical protein